MVIRYIYARHRDQKAPERRQLAFEIDMLAARENADIRD